MHGKRNESEEQDHLWTTLDGNYYFVFRMADYLQNCNYLGLPSFVELGITY